MQLRTVLIVDDDRDHLHSLTQILEERFKVIAVSASVDALERARNTRPDVVLLDDLMPEPSGLALCRMLKESEDTCDIPVLLFSGHDHVSRRTEALKAGAADFIVKPYYAEELIARLETRMKEPQPALTGFADLKLHPADFSIDIGDRRHILSRMEFRMLQFFVNHSQKVQSRKAILHALWGNEPDVHDRTVDSHIVSLRRAIKGSRAEISSVYGAGYVLRERPADPRG